MSKFKELSTQKDGEQQRDFYAKSHCDECGEEARITLFDVRDNRTGYVSRGAASEFSEVGKDNNCTWVARSNFLVMQAYGYCGDCYLSEAQAARTLARSA